MSPSLSNYHLSPDILARLKGRDLSDRLLNNHTTVAAYGAYSDVWQSEIAYTGKSRVAVAVKRMRFLSKDDIERLFEKEIYVWSKLKHKNVLPLLGYAFEKNTGYPLLISKWMCHGSASDYVRARSEFNPFHFFHLIVGIARGINYLHKEGVFHSDIKGANILISKSEPPEAVIGDFGFARMIQASLSLGRPSYTEKGTVRWMAYELHMHHLDGSQPKPHSKATDVWAFGMTIYELFTKKSPYHHYSFNVQVGDAIRRKELPTFPESSPSAPSHLTDLLSDVCKKCWNHDPAERIKMPEVMELLKSDSIYGQLKEENSANGDSDDTESAVLVEDTDIFDHSEESPTNCIAFCQDGTHFAVGCNQVIHVYCTDSGRKKCTLSYEHLQTDGNLYVRSLCFIHYPGVMASCTGDDKVQIWYTSRKEPAMTPNLDTAGQIILSLASSETLLVCGIGDGTARIYDVITREIGMLGQSGDHQAVAAVAISSDKKFVATSSSDQVRIWDVQTRRLLHNIEGHSGIVTSIAFTRKGDKMITASGTTIKKWDIHDSSLTESKTYSGHANVVHSIAVSNDGRWVMSGSKDGTVRIWALDSGMLEKTCREHSDEIVSVDFSPDNNKFLTASRDGRVILWNYDTK